MLPALVWRIGSSLAAPFVHAQGAVTLRQFGTGVSNINIIAEQAKADLGITIEMTALDTDTTAQRIVTQPKGFDIADIEYFTVKKVWGAGNMQPMDTSRIDNYDSIVGLFKNGKLTPESVIAQGTAPHTVGFVEKVWRQGLCQRRNRSDDAGSNHLQR